MAKPTILLCVLMACAVCHSDRSRSAPSAPLPAKKEAAVLDPAAPLRVELLGSQVRSARAWTSAVVPNARGGWNFITQSWEHGSQDPPEWVVVDLQTGATKLFDAPRNEYAVNKFQVRTQLRAPNGRVFFPLSDMGLAYYEPADETVKVLPPVITPPGPDKIIFDAKLGPDGMLYAGTQSNRLPTIVQIDPKTLKTRVLGHVGHDRKTYSYAYQLAVDPPWVYATVGEMPWELAALNIDTGESRILATRSGDQPWMSLETRPEGIRAQLITGVHTPQVHSDYVWCVDGKTLPADLGTRPSFKAHKLVPPDASIPGAPDIDITRLNPDISGIGRIRWRPAGSTDWKVAEFKVKHTTPIDIEALIALPDGSVLGGSKQYHGLFKTDGSSLAFLGGPTPSRTVFEVLDGTVYAAGYPNSVLYAYDPGRPWTGTTADKASEPGANPRMLGNFAQSGAKYGAFMTASADRLYYAGWLERDGVGTGVGYYQPSTKQFGGQHDRLADLMPSGLAFVPDVQRVVLSTHVRHGSQATHGELVVLDKDLKEVDRFVVRPDLADTGLVFATPLKGVIIAVTSDAVYRYAITEKHLVDWKPLSGTVLAVAPRRDGSLWAVVGASLVRIDPRTLDTVTFGSPDSLPAGIEHLVWQGADLYASVGADLYRIARVGLP